MGLKVFCGETFGEEGGRVTMSKSSRWLSGPLLAERNPRGNGGFRETRGAFSGSMHQNEPSDMI
jgi:hypothetical protein